MDEKKYQIFISSTYEDLKEEREAVRDGILSIRQFPVGMETFGASSRNQWDVIKDTIDESDYYVLIVGHKYGSEITEGEFKGISYTEREYRYAKEKEIPILAFIKKDDNVQESEKESDPHRLAKLADFKSDVMDHRTVAFWSSKYDLKPTVISSLHQEFDVNKRPGWIRGGSGVSRREKVVNSGGKKKKIRDDTVDKFDLIMDELKFSGGGMTVSELMQETKMSRDSIQNMLRQLVERGLVEKKGTKRNIKYIVEDPSNPTDGYHVFRNRAGVVLKEGTWKDGELIDGKEYNWIIKDDNHVLRYNCETQDYDGEAGTKITDYAQYDADFFSMYLMDSELEYEGLEHYYISDIIVKNGTFEYINIRKLENWLEEREPRWLKLYREMMESNADN